MRGLWPVARLGLNLVLTAAGFAIVVFLVVRLRLVVLPVIIAILVATLLVPPADALRRRLPSSAATLTVMAVAVGLLGGILAVVVPPIVGEVDDVGRSARAGLNEALRWLSGGPLGIERSQVEGSVDRALDRLRQDAGGVGAGLLSGAVLVAEAIAGFALVVVLVFFFVHDGRRIWSWAVSLLPASYRPDARTVGDRIWLTLSGYVRGVIVIALVDATLIGLALWIIGVPLVLPLAALTFLGAFIPLVGAVVAGAVAALVALVTKGFVAAILVVVAITVIQQLEGDLLYPVVVGRAIALHPVAILLALTAGTVLAGLIGALVAVPVTAAAWDAIDHIRANATHGRQGASISTTDEDGVVKTG